VEYLKNKATEIGIQATMTDLRLGLTRTLELIIFDYTSELPINCQFESSPKLEVREEKKTMRHKREFLFNFQPKNEIKKFENVYIENIAALQKQRLERRKTTKSSL
jgi:hypothetical protein